MAIVNVYAARTWGAMGNFVAAAHLSRVLARDGRHTVTVTASEDLVPFMRSAGHEIRDINLLANSREELNRTYRGFAGRSAEALPPGFETSRTAPPVDLGGVVQDLERQRPDIAVATKGVIARMLVWAVRETGLSTKIWHYVTNPGLAEMPMHHCPDAHVTSVPWPGNRDRLLQLVALPRASVRVTGPLLAARSMPPAPASSPEPRRPVILLFNNRGGSVFPDAVEHLLRARDDFKVVYLTVDQPSEAAALSKPFVSRGWEIHERLPQERYLQILAEASCSPGSFLVCKASPATVYEAAYQGIPLLALPSGLPQEEWVPEFVLQHDIGRTVYSADELIRCMDLWRVPGATAKIRAACDRFRRTRLNQAQAEENVLRVADDLLLEGV
ncbi:hypothetical protein [Actinomyces wuliandei]|uniref:hypothetical protein n=1 Tax=Actinomyces wuliandei TaxID=2057743 RepID=UPI000FD9F101|nr:hypothetical protein [Actinomyces wuliandei]